MSLCLPLTRRLKSPDLFSGIDRLPALGTLLGGRTFEIFNPSTGELWAELPDMGVQETRAAIDKAHAAQAEWAALTARERSDMLWLWRWHELIVTHTDDLATILTAEMGKPLAEAKSEVSHAAAYLQWYTEEANRIYGETISAPSTDRRMLVIKQAIGVVGTITPWNFPASMVARKISPALAAGCTIVLKPAEQTPLVAGAMFALTAHAGFPDGVVNLVYASEGNAVGRELCFNRQGTQNQLHRIDRGGTAAHAPVLGPDQEFEGSTFERGRSPLDGSVSVLNRPRSPRRRSRSGGMLRIADPCGLIVEGRAEDPESHPWRAGSDLLRRKSAPSRTLFSRMPNHNAAPGTHPVPSSASG